MRLEGSYTMQDPRYRPENEWYYEATLKKLDKIPDWVALTAVGGALISLYFFVLIFITRSEFAGLGLTLGVSLLFISLYATYRAINK